MGRNAPCPCGSGLKAKKCSNTPTCLGSSQAS
ncbi:MAG: SEC-C metal-binding domain-containing protein [Acidimicrobiia bacterium]|nr:SEC-C metal-binding domain-containing protein [Acidimicrobiia bacterium]